MKAIQCKLKYQSFWPFIFSPKETLVVFFHALHSPLSHISSTLVKLKNFRKTLFCRGYSLLTSSFTRDCTGSKSEWQSKQWWGGVGGNGSDPHPPNKSIKSTLRLCNIFLGPPAPQCQIIGSQFSAPPPPILFWRRLILPPSPKNHVILAKSSTHPHYDWPLIP